MTGDGTVAGDGKLAGDASVRIRGETSTDLRAIEDVTAAAFLNAPYTSSAQSIDDVLLGVTPRRRWVRRAR